MNTGLGQYMDIFKDAVEDSAVKLTKSFEKILFEVIILFMVIPRKINFTQMGRYGSHVEQTYRNAFGLKSRRALTGSNLMSHLPIASSVNSEDGLLPLIPVTSAKLARRLHISVVIGRDMHRLLNMVSKSCVLVSLILMPKTA